MQLVTVSNDSNTSNKCKHKHLAQTLSCINRVFRIFKKSLLGIALLHLCFHKIEKTDLGKLFILSILIAVSNTSFATSQVTNFDFENIPQQSKSEGKSHRIGNFNWQQAHQFGIAFNIANSELTLTQSIDDAALVMDVNNIDYDDKDYYIRVTMKPPAGSGFAFTGLLAHADVGGTAHPETHGVALGIMRISGKYYLKLKQWTDGDIYGFGQGNPELNNLDPNKWYTLELHVKPRGTNDTQFSGAIYLCDNQVNPTVADIGSGVPLQNGNFQDLWNPDTGELDNSDPPQWNPRLHNIALFQWLETGHKFSSIGIAKTQSDFIRPLIIASSRSSITGQTVTLKTSPMKPVASYSWDFGDGTTSTLANPSKTYDTPGIYTVTLTTSYSDGDVATSEPQTIIVEPASGSNNSADSFTDSQGKWRYEDAGLNGASLSQAEVNYINGNNNDGALNIQAFNHSPGWSQNGFSVMEDSVATNAGGRWYKPVYLTEQKRISVKLRYKVAASNLASTDTFKLLLLDGDTVIREWDFTGNINDNYISDTVEFIATPGIHKLGLGLWVEKLHTNGTIVDSDEGSAIRRSNLLTHRFDHSNDNSMVAVAYDDVSITITPILQRGQVAATYLVPSNFNSLNGLAWDGTQLWGVDYVSSNTGKAYRMDITSAATASAPTISNTLDLAMYGLEGAAHDRVNTLYVGPRLSGSRASAQVIGADASTTSTSSTYTDFLWPDLQSHGDYKDPDGIAHDGTNVYWVVNADHTAELNNAGVQVIGPTGNVLKRFWLPDEKPNDVTYAGGYLIYKPATQNVIKLIDVSAVADGNTAIADEVVTITGATIIGHWGAAHDGKNFLYLSQDPAGGTIWKIYLPLSKTTDTMPPSPPQQLQVF